jgi:hypothetical protein
MNAYFFKMNQEEKKNILDQHKSIYNGYKTNYGMNSEQPLFVQDFANDKNGVTVSNKGNVSVYKNMNINESDASTGAKYIPDETFDFGGPDEYVPMEEQLDMIGDGEDDLEHGTFEDDDDTDIMLISPEHDEYDNEEDDYKDLSMYNPYYGDDEEPEFEDMDIEDVLGLSNDDEEDDEIISSLQEQVNKSLDMFRRFKNYL